MSQVLGRDNSLGSNTDLSPGIVDRRLRVHVSEVKAVVHAEAHDHDASNRLHNAEIPVLGPFAKSCIASKMTALIDNECGT